jgi:hypothetical protein
MGRKVGMSDERMLTSMRTPKDSANQHLLETVLARVRSGGIADLAELKENLAANSLPESLPTMKVEDYERFLAERRRLMAIKLRDYYGSL